MSSRLAVSPLAISLGDPAGVGPELIAEAWARRHDERLPAFFVAGGRTALEAAAAARDVPVPVIRIEHAEDAAAAFAHGLPVLGAPGCARRPGRPDAEGARLALDSLDRACALAREGQAGGLVTAPVSKARLAEIGFAYPGQTEFVAQACGYAPSDVAMMLAGPSLRTVPVTIHIPLAEVSARLTSALIERKGRIAAMALIRDFGIATPRLAVAGLNPHAGEEGRMGDEEARLIAPAIAALRAEGVDIVGPYPADALFTEHMRQSFDAALCMYHDQALIPLKTLDFDSGVNLTLGLPIVRTSPDHGTAFALAGTGKASANAMIAAIRMAGECAARRAQA